MKKKRVAKTTKVSRGRQLIDQLVEFLNNSKGRYNAEEIRSVWDILTGLRGPDNDRFQFMLKTYTTERLRGAIGLAKRRSGDYQFNIANMATISNEPLMYIEDGVQNIRERIMNTQGWFPDTHFQNHYERALVGLEFLGYADRPTPTTSKKEA